MEQSRADEILSPSTFADHGYLYGRVAGLMDSTSKTHLNSTCRTGGGGLLIMFKIESGPFCKEYIHSSFLTFSFIDKVL